MSKADEILDGPGDDLEEFPDEELRDYEQEETGTSSISAAFERIRVIVSSEPLNHNYHE